MARGSGDGVGERGYDHLYLANVENLRSKIDFDPTFEINVDPTFGINVDPTFEINVDPTFEINVDPTLISLIQR